MDLGAQCFKRVLPVTRFQNLRAFDGNMIQTVCFLLGGCLFFRRVATVTLASIHQDSNFACRFMAGVPKFYREAAPGYCWKPKLM